MLKALWILGPRAWVFEGFEAWSLGFTLHGSGVGASAGNAKFFCSDAQNVSYRLTSQLS